LSYVYDAGALIAAERSSRDFAQLHRKAVAEGTSPVVPAAVLAQVWTGSPRQALLVRLLRSCVIDDFDAAQARIIGRLRALSGTTDVVDVSVVETALRRGLTIVTSDPDDMTRIIGALDMGRPHIERI
jgi:predicted nucleic acid-binding protein